MSPHAVTKRRTLKPDLGDHTKRSRPCCNVPSLARFHISSHAATSAPNRELHLLYHPFGRHVGRNPATFFRRPSLPSKAVSPFIPIPLCVFPSWMRRRFPDIQTCVKKTRLKAVSHWQNEHFCSPSAQAEQYERCMHWTATVSAA